MSRNGVAPINAPGLAPVVEIVCMTCGHVEQRELLWEWASSWRISSYCDSHAPTAGALGVKDATAVHEQRRRKRVTA